MLYAFGPFLVPFFEARGVRNVAGMIVSTRDDYSIEKLLTLSAISIYSQVSINLPLLMTLDEIAQGSKSILRRSIVIQPSRPHLPWY